MKRQLLILMAMANVVMAQPAGMTDPQIKALIVGTWTYSCNYSTFEYKSDGTFVFNLDGTDVVEKWDVKDGALLETDSSIGRTCYYKILFLTENELLTLGMTPHVKGYSFYWRKDVDL